MSHQKPVLEHSFSNHFQIIKRIYHEEFNSHGVEKYIEMFLCFVKLFMPGFWIRNAIKNYKLRNTVLELYILGKVSLLARIVCCGIHDDWAVYVAMYFLVDIVQHLLGLIFLSNVYTFFPSLEKNVAHLALNVLEIVFAFAVLYLHFDAVGSHGVVSTDPVSLLYFSMVTFATVGYGDIGPITTLGKAMVGCQILISFLFVSIICGSFVTDMRKDRD